MATVQAVDVSPHTISPHSSITKAVSERLLVLAVEEVVVKGRGRFCDPSGSMRDCRPRLSAAADGSEELEQQGKAEGRAVGGYRRWCVNVVLDGEQ